MINYKTAVKTIISITPNIMNTIKLYTLNVNYSPNSPNSPNSPDLFLFIDFQKVFETDTVWNVPDFKQTLNQANIAYQLVSKYRYVRPIATMYLPPPISKNSVWETYFNKYPSIPRNPCDDLYDLCNEVPTQSVLDYSTFGKWDDYMNQCANNATNVFITGVSTDCCVLSTALTAVDSGKKVYIISDACAAGTTENHNRAIEIMKGFSPNIEVITTKEINLIFKN
jgi:hypothetical protein